MAVAAVAYKLVTRSQLNSRKEDLFRARDSIETDVGREWAKVSDKLEKLTLNEAAEYRGDLLDKSAVGWDFRSLPGLYLRVRVNDAQSIAKLRVAAEDSARDGFTSCLIRPTTSGVVAADAGASLDRPWNLRQGYIATRVLTPEWKAMAAESNDDHRLRVFEEQYQKATREDLPLATAMVKQAEFYLLVLDEDVDDARDPDGGAIVEESLQLVKHPARVVLVNLKTGAPVFRTRKSSEGSYIFGGERAISDPEVFHAMKRQVNNCALATDVKNVLGLDSHAANDAGK